MTTTLPCLTQRKIVMITCFNRLPYILTLEGYKFDNCRNKSADSTINLVDRTFIDCTFTKCDFLQVNLTNTKFINCTLIDCDLYNTDISRTNLRGTVIKGETRLPLEGLDTCNLPKKSTFILAQPVSIIIHNRECIQIEDEVHTYEKWLELTEPYWLGQYGSGRVKPIMSYVRRTINFYLQGK